MKSKIDLTKKIATKIKHAKKMFRKRFGHELSDSEYNELNQLARSPESEVVMWQKGHGSVVRLKWREFEFFAVYAHQLESIVTFLTLDMKPKIFEDED